MARAGVIGARVENEDVSLHDSIRMPGALRWTDSPAPAIALAALLSGLVVVGSLATWGLGDEGLLRMTRYTARLAFPFFPAAFGLAVVALMAALILRLVAWLRPHPTTQSMAG